jgi:hypothetical protein
MKSENLPYSIKTIIKWIGKVMVKNFMQVVDGNLIE